MATCPNCAREVIEDVTHCPFCGAPLKPTCPSCKREIQPDYLMCPYCGFNLSSEAPAERLSKKGGMSTVPTVIIALTFVGGFIDFLQGASESTYDYAVYLFPISPPFLAKVLLLAQVAIGVLLVILGIVQLVVAFGLVSGLSYSRRRILLRLVSLLFLLSIVELSSDTVISSMDSLSRVIFALDIFFVLWSFFLLVVVWRYVNQQDEREILSQTAPVEFQG
ncbi:MAG: zinc ribbon domain-containing protein [Thaumarchaeota archaeon]|nr:zinc ribbon domain-containing protein [Nitrososphaerota archaeon]